MLGIKPQDGHYAFELYRAAHKLVTEVRPIRHGQQVLITADTSSDLRVARAVAGAVQAVGGVPALAWYPTLPEPMQPPPATVAGAASAADIWFDFSVSYQLYNPTYQTAIDNGCIYV